MMKNLLSTWTNKSKYDFKQKEKKAIFAAP